MRRSFLHDVPITTRHAIRKLSEPAPGRDPVTIKNLAIRYRVTEGIIRAAIKWSKDATTESKIDW